MKQTLKARREQILDLLSKVPLSSTVELAELTQVSCETMRKDLEALAAQNYIVKVHGGVALSDNALIDSSYDSRSNANTLQKSVIARAAANFIDENDTIVLEGSTTCMEVAKALLYKPDILKTLTIFTNSLNIASLFNDGQLCKGLFYLGGWLNPREHSCRGIHTAGLLKDFYVDKGFISGATIKEDLMLRSYLQDDMLFQRQVIESSKISILMMDSSKFDKSALYTVCDVSALSVFITDVDLKSPYHEMLQRKNTHYVNTNIK